MDRIDRFLEKRDESCACMGQQPEGAVSVVSEDPVVIAVSRETLEQISEMGDGTELVIHAASKEEIREKIGQGSPDIVLLAEGKL